ncbi:MAG TPA: Fur family transcriptional regulator [Candidatus Limnocylindria bacterium]|nr:Fur family transcriptional regulator [Candidatus Limnocylindria bacterium]
MDRISLAAADRLTAAGERVTRQRLLVADALAASGRRLTAEQLYRSLRRRDPAIGRATVFRTLETLVEAGVARRLELDGHVYAYVACLPAHHHHIACTRCGRVEEIDEAYVTPIAERLAEEMGFEIDDARLDFYGRCATCRAEDAATA